MLSLRWRKTQQHAPACLRQCAKKWWKKWRDWRRVGLGKRPWLVQGRERKTRYKKKTWRKSKARSLDSLLCSALSRVANNIVVTLSSPLHCLTWFPNEVTYVIRRAWSSATTLLQVFSWRELQKFFGTPENTGPNSHFLFLNSDFSHLQMLHCSTGKSHDKNRRKETKKKQRRKKSWEEEADWCSFVRFSLEIEAKENRKRTKRTQKDSTNRKQTWTLFLQIYWPCSY